LYLSYFRAVNAVLPESKLKPSSSKIAFKQMENVGNFLKAINHAGVATHDQFQTVDLYENKNIVQVIDTILTFSRIAQKSG
jgi:hypothetical protein